MTKSRFSAEALESGMTMGVNLLSMLHKKIVERGGSPILLYHLTVPEGQKLLDQVADLIVSERIPILRSEIEELAFKKSRDEGHSERMLESDRRFFWAIIDLERTYGIDTQIYSRLEGSDHPLIPEEIACQIADKPLVYPLTVTYDGETYVVVNLHAEERQDPMVGDVWTDDDLTEVRLAKASYFDLEH